MSSGADLLSRTAVLLACTVAACAAVLLFGGGPDLFPEEPDAETPPSEVRPAVAPRERAHTAKADGGEYPGPVDAKPPAPREAPPEPPPPDADKFIGTGVKILKDYSGRPDKKGVMERYVLAVPEFEIGVYYGGSWWPAGGNRVYPAVVRDLSGLGEGGMFLLLKLKGAGYLAILPLACRNAYSWFDSDGGKLVLKMGTHGKDAIRGDIPLYAWSRAAGLYEACHNAWAAALECAPVKDLALLREKKEYPEVFRYLGWCSWEHYKGKVDEANMVQAMRDIEQSKLPIRFFLVDNGHFDSRSLRPDAKKFPRGYRPLTDMRKEDKIKWVGIWYAFLGNNHGVTAPGNLGEVGQSMYECPAGKLLPVGTEESARRFYEYMLGFAKRDGVDFLKVDFQTDALPFYAGVTDGNPLGGPPRDNSRAVGNPLEASANLARVFQTVVDERMKGLINCNWHNAVSLFNSMNSVVGRCSEDYKVGDLNRAKGHLHHSYAAIPWLGQIAWGDHDMFHSNDPAAGRVMAVSKAMSGGPVYLSDDPKNFAPQNVRPLCFEDGELLRPLAPASPLPESIFVDPFKEAKPYRVVAPLAGDAAAIVVYNLTKKGVPVRASVTSEDYTHAGGMVQPYEGKWKVPAEGLVYYDWNARRGGKLEGEYSFELEGFGDRLVILCPIRSGWAVVGRTDKFLSPAGVDVVSVSENELTIRMVESGPLAVWRGTSSPWSTGITFTNAGNDLYMADLPVGERYRPVTIGR